MLEINTLTHFFQHSSDATRKKELHLHIIKEIKSNP